VRDEAEQVGIVPATTFDLPFWYSDAGITQYLWIDQGTHINYKINDG
jgi:hypothetical protein